jgi:hypothetical protein
MFNRVTNQNGQTEHTVNAHRELAFSLHRVLMLHLVILVLSNAPVLQASQQVSKFTSEYPFLMNLDSFSVQVHSSTFI